MKGTWFFSVPRRVRRLRIGSSSWAFAVAVMVAVAVMFTVSIVVSSSKALAACADGAFYSEVLRSSDDSKLQPALWNTFDFSVRYTREEAAREVDRRLPPFAWTIPSPALVESENRKSLGLMRGKLAEIVFGGDLFDRTSIADWLRLEAYHAKYRLTPARRFEDLPHNVSRQELAELTLLHVNTLLYRDRFADPSMLNEIYRAVEIFSLVMSLDSFRPDTLIEEKADFDRSRRLFESYFRGAQAKFFMTFSQLDLVDLVQLAAAGYFPIGVLLTETEWWDGSEQPAARFPVHDRAHAMSQIQNLIKSHQEKPSPKNDDVLRFEYDLTRALLIEAFALPTANERVIAVYAIYTAKHESGSPLLDELAPDQGRGIRTLEMMLNPDPTLSIENLKRRTQFLGPLKGFGRLTADQITPEVWHPIHARFRSLASAMKRARYQSAGMQSEFGATGKSGGRP